VFALSYCEETRRIEVLVSSSHEEPLVGEVRLRDDDLPVLCNLALSILGCSRAQRSLTSSHTLAQPTWHVLGTSHLHASLHAHYYASWCTCTISYAQHSHQGPYRASRHQSSYPRSGLSTHAQNAFMKTCIVREGRGRLVAT